MQEPVAIVHDWLTSMRGGERVVEALYGVFPHADLFTLTWNPSRLSPALAQRRATTSLIHRVANAPFVSGRFRGLLPLFPLAVESFRLDRYALVVSSSHCVAMGAIAPPSALHVAYVHSTLRYVREAQKSYEASVPGGRIGRFVFRGTAHYLRRWEAAAATRPHVLIANSTYTQERIRKYYQREALVIAPPIETRRFEQASTRVCGRDAEAPFLVVSALVPNKRVDLALRAFQGRRERLIVVGEGPERPRLEKLAGPNITFRSRVDESEIASLFAQSRALVHTGVDDFGMVMVEALAAGKPVIACAEGGALDIVRDGETGLLIEEPTVQSVRAAIDRFDRLSESFDPIALRSFAKRFDRDNFERQFAEAVDQARRRRHDSMSQRTHRVVVGTGKDKARTVSNGTSVHGLNGTSARGLNGKGSVQAKVHSNGTYTANGSNGSRPIYASTHLLWKQELEEELADREAPSPAAKSDEGAKPAPELRGTPAQAPIRPPSPAMAAKRLLDVTLATSALLATGPLVLALGALIRLDSKGPALFYQERTGLDQRPFTMLKLRTMDDKRAVTRVGQWLRPLGLDELPQLWNVIRGEMSLVGPRPELPHLVERFERELPGFCTRHRMRPGITGWAQVNGLRGHPQLSMAQRLEFDLQYLRDWSLALDARILLRTVSTVLGDTLRSFRE